MRYALLVIVPLTTALSGRLPAAETAPATGQRVSRPIRSRLFRHQYTIYDRDFCGVQVCVDFDNDGTRELIYASRATGNLQQLRAADGTVKWSRSLKGKQQSVAVYDFDGDDRYEILYSVSNPGDLYLLGGQDGRVRKTYRSGDHKLGNSAVIIDADGDGVLDGFFGSRNRWLVRLDLQKVSHVARRTGWVQCGCYTSALDVDRDGRWDLFAGSGDDYSAKGVLHRYDPVTLQSVWSYRTDDNASSADPVLADIDGDGRVEIVKSVDNYKKDDAHDVVYAFETDGKLLWKTTGLSGEDSPNVADLDGDGSPEIVGMTFGGEVYCLDAQGRFKWRKDLRPKLGNDQHMYLAPILCDLDGDAELEILVMTNGQYSPQPGVKPNAVIFALDAKGDELDRFDLGESRFWGHAFVANIDEDPFLELVVSGFGGVDVIETRGYGPNTEHFQRRRSFQRLNVLPWAYEDSFFIYRGKKEADDFTICAGTVVGYLASLGRQTNDFWHLDPGMARSASGILILTDSYSFSKGMNRSSVRHRSLLMAWCWSPRLLTTQCDSGELTVLSLSQGLPNPVRAETRRAYRFTLPNRPWPHLVSKIL